MGYYSFGEGVYMDTIKLNSISLEKLPGGDKG